MTRDRDPPSPIQESQRIRMLPLEGEVIAVLPVCVGRDKRTSRSSGIYHYRIRLDDGRVDHFSLRDFEVIEESQGA